jgi:hypothetical protein
MLIVHRKGVLRMARREGGVFKRFDWDGLKVIKFGQRETAQMRRGKYGTEALLLGLICSGNKAAQILAECGVELEEVRAFARGLDEKVDNTPVNIPFTKDCLTIIENAVDALVASQCVNDVALLRSLLISEDKTIEHFWALDMNKKAKLLSHFDL